MGDIGWASFNLCLEWRFLDPWTPVIIFSLLCLLSQKMAKEQIAIRVRFKASLEETFHYYSFTWHLGVKHMDRECQFHLVIGRRF